MLYMPALDQQRADHSFSAKLWRISSAIQIHKITYNTAIADYVAKQPCDNCGTLHTPNALRVRHGLTRSYATCVLCDIELEND